MACGQRGCLAHLFSLTTSTGPIHITSNVFTIGRVGTNLAIDSPTQKCLVSRHHATIQVENNGGHRNWKITDHNSTNGLLVNLRKIKESPLKTGDRIYLGGASAAPIGSEIKSPATDLVFQFEECAPLLSSSGSDLAFASPTLTEGTPKKESSTPALPAADTVRYSSAASSPAPSTTTPKASSAASTPSPKSNAPPMPSTPSLTRAPSLSKAVSSSKPLMAQSEEDELPLPQGPLSKKPPSDWTVDEVLNWLSHFIPRMWFRSYKHIFEKEGVDGERLLAITEDELKNDLKIDMFSFRRELMLEVRRLTLQDELNAPEASQQVLEGDEDPLQNAQSIDSEDHSEPLEPLPTTVKRIDLTSDQEDEEAGPMKPGKKKKKRKPYQISDESGSEIEVAENLRPARQESREDSDAAAIDDERAKSDESDKRDQGKADEADDSDESEAIEAPEPKEPAKRKNAAAKKKVQQKKKQKRGAAEVEEVTEPPNSAQLLALEDLQEAIKTKKIDLLRSAITAATRFKLKSAVVDEAKDLLEHLIAHPEEEAPDHVEEVDSAVSQAKKQLQDQVDRELALHRSQQHQQSQQQAQAKAAETAAVPTTSPLPSAPSAVPSATSPAQSAAPTAPAVFTAKEKAAATAAAPTPAPAASATLAGPAAPPPHAASASPAPPSAAKPAAPSSAPAPTAAKPLAIPASPKRSTASSAAPAPAATAGLNRQGDDSDSEASQLPPHVLASIGERDDPNVVVITSNSSSKGGGGLFNFQKHVDDSFIHPVPLSEGAVPAQTASPTSTPSTQSLSLVPASGVRPTVNPIVVDDDGATFTPTAQSPHPERHAHSPASPESTTTRTEPVQISNIITNILQMQQDLREEAATPEQLTTALFPFQRQSLAWMMKREKTRPFGGILADEMGLGKTVQTIACMLSHRPQKNAPHMTLIVCPLSCLFQWRDELLSKAKEGTWTVHAYHGIGKVKRREELAQYDVVLTTYSTLAMEIPKDYTPGSSDRRHLGILFRMNWFRVVLDEAHSIKNRQTRQAKACFALESQIRWALSATPIQNTLDDMYSLFRFLRHDPYADLSTWKTFIGNTIKSNRAEHGLKRLRTLLSEILICRTKSTRDADGKPIVQLPERTVFIRRDKFTAAEWDFYQALWTSSKVQFDAYLRQGTVIQNYTNILVMLTRLRQACDHPALVLRDRIWRKGDAPPALSASTICHLCHDLLGEEVGTTPCQHQFCRACLLDALADSERAPRCAFPDCGRNFTEDEISEMSSAHPARRSDPRATSGDIESSTKIEVLMRELRVFYTQATDTKGIIFSQWTSMLDLIEPVLKSQNYKFVRLDGSMSIQQRRNAITAFKENPEIRIFLISLKAGGLGLNLTVANYVFMLDLWWNPAVEDQAIDRVHRVGQQRNVQVVRFTIENTIEDRILELQARKRQIAEGALGKTDGKGVNPYGQKLTVADLVHLFSEAADSRPVEGEPQRAPESLLPPVQLLPSKRPKLASSASQLPQSQAQIQSPSSSQMELVVPAPAAPAATSAHSSGYVTTPMEQLSATIRAFLQSQGASATASSPASRSSVTSQAPAPLPPSSARAPLNPITAAAHEQFATGIAQSKRPPVNINDFLKPPAPPAPEPPRNKPPSVTGSKPPPQQLTLSTAKAKAATAQPPRPSLQAVQQLLAQRAQASVNNWRNRVPMTRRLALRTEKLTELRHVLPKVTVPIDQVQSTELNAWTLATSVEDYLQRLSSGFVKLKWTLQQQQINEEMRLLTGRK